MSTITKFYCNIVSTDCLYVYQIDNDLCLNTNDIDNNIEIILNKEDCKKLIYELQLIESKLV